MKSNKRNNNGISLIVLVITIIIMIILAGAIILSLNGSGIIGKANKAKRDNDMQAAKEIVTMALADWQLNKTKLVEENAEINFEKYAEEKLRNAGYKTEGTGGLKVNSECGINTIYIDVNDEEVLIPEGFVVSSAENENIVEKGLVIYEGTEKVTDENKYEAQRTRDQFVWVPVENIEDFVPKDGYFNGKQTHVEDGVVTEPYITEDDATGEMAEYERIKESVEKYHGFYIARYEAGDGNVNQERTGFTPRHIVVSRKDAYVYNHVSWGRSMTDIGKSYDYGSTKNIAGAVSLSRDMYNTKSVSTNLIYGVQWDEVMTYVSADVSISDSKAWGNYADSTGLAEANRGVMQTCGKNEAWKAKNIYDLAGNAYEYTMEVYNNESRIIRSGKFNVTGLYSPASARQNIAAFGENGNTGFRVALYLK